jgi:adenine-specific DNA-methyltransferase
MLEPAKKSALGQFMTPSAVASFMAEMFGPTPAPAKLLDAGAGIGSLTAAAAGAIPNLSYVGAWEVDPFMREHLSKNLKRLGVEHHVHAEDFILSATPQIAFATGVRFTHAILNPPYKKLNSNSTHRAMLRKVGVETVNLYTAFVALAILLMEQGGQIVAIIPRSFCNGLYYKPFRQFMLERSPSIGSTSSKPAIRLFETMTFFRRT